MTIAVYAGSFDPITKGHLYIIKQAAKLFNHVVVVVASNPDKKHLLSMDERVALINGETAYFPNVTVRIHDGYVGEFANDINANILVRGVRGLTDSEYELKMADYNLKHYNIPTIFLPTHPSIAHISSSSVKDSIRLGAVGMDSYCSNYVRNSIMKAMGPVVFIGRFQPPHSQHIAIIEQAAKTTENVIVVLGSCQESRTFKNPWNFYERKEMILLSLNKETTNKIMFVQSADNKPDDRAWADSIKSSVFRVAPSKRYRLTGYRKDDSSFYLDLFPNWELQLIERHEPLNATDIRNQFFSTHPPEVWGKDLHPNVVKYLINWRYNNSEIYKNLCTQSGK